jgi:uncharacterized protein DUF1549/uncharacterized protein DUF1553/concanavalin A-like lectin/glucanase superfamily protein/cytochrome c
MNSRSTNGLALKLSVLLLSCLFFSQLMRGAPARAVQNTAPAREIVFNRDIRPILADKCWSCHGPDAPAKKMKLRLDSEDAATADLGGGRRAIVPGNPEQSQLVRRITSGDEMTRMPPVDSGRKLTQAEVDLLVEWVRQGARWQRHWSFITPIRPSSPQIKNKGWPKNAIDHFVLERLEREGVEPSPEADRATLIRRVSLDLTGLPPTPREVEDFLADESPNAYEKVVDRLLASPRYGERLAFRWLDAARYADTNGYQVDGDRSAWRWRDWVIEAFNRDKPFDQFVVEQLAGDLLPDATLDQKIATAFNRNHRINAEAGIVPEEYLIEYVVDRVDTTSTVFMGLTLGCARCHNHKYDPFTQKEYYQLAAYFNSIDEGGRSFDQGNAPPVIAAPAEKQQRRLRQFTQEIALAERRYNALAEKSAKTRRRWEKSLLASNNANRQWFPDDRLIARLPLDAQSAPVFRKSDRAHHDQGAGRKDEPNRKIESWFKDGSPRYVESPAGQGAVFDGKIYIDAGLHADFRYKTISTDYRERFTIAAWVYPESEQSGSIVTKVSDSPAEVENNVPRAEGYGLYFINGKIHFNMVLRWGEDTLQVETEEPLPQRRWSHVAVIFDGLKSWEDRLRIFVDGREAKLKFNQRTLLVFTGGASNTLKIGAGGGPQFRFKGALDEVRIYSRALDADEIAALACADSLKKIAAIPAANRTRAQALKIHGAFLAQAAPGELKRARDTLVEMKRHKQSFEDDFPTLMVMEEMSRPRPTFLLKRGAYDAPGEKVERGVPAALPPFRRGGHEEAARIAPMSNRLDFARWLVSAEHPLTSRVAVNRFWQMLFGAGLVRTSEDFGTRGESPSHPELLDWLAVEFRDGSGTGSDSDLVGVGQRDLPGNPLATARGTVPAAWNVKSLLKTMVMSATYRQSSKITPQSQQRDPDNLLLARGPRFRLPAEMIRDQALFVSGLLVEKLGGPSVKPYQPDGLYKDMAFSGLTGYDRDEGEGLWRRSLYTFWKRTVLSPTMRVFDASAREYCTVRDTRTNTPLQSLNLMNDVTYVEAARLLAQRMLREGGATPQARVAWAYLAAASRRPRDIELQVLLRNLSWQMNYFSRNRREAKRLLSVGKRRNDAKFDTVELAAYTAIASLILNLDEVITKQ